MPCFARWRAGVVQERKLDDPRRPPHRARRCPLLAICFATCCSSIESSLSSNARQQTCTATCANRTSFFACAPKLCALCPASFAFVIEIQASRFCCLHQSVGGLSRQSSLRRLRRHVAPLIVNAFPTSLQDQLSASFVYKMPVGQMLSEILLLCACTAVIPIWMRIGTAVVFQSAW